MKPAFRTYIPHDLSPGERYDMISSLVVPRPIAFVSSLAADGTPNLAPYSFFMAGGINPLSLVFVPTLTQNGEPKDSLRNVEETGEYVINLVTRQMADGMNQTGLDYPPEVSEWGPSGFTAIESEAVKPKRVLESAVQFECKLFQVVRHGDGASSAAYVIGEVVRTHLNEELVEQGPRSFRPIARMGGPDYFDLSDGKVFELARPNREPDSS
jgi:flavin reductase (DIM6/NTAB) family NADH-FMN oxidoreductase RutF